MPLPPSLDREELHVRRIEFRGFKRSDGQFEIEGHLTDVKNNTFLPKGAPTPILAHTPLHEMWIRVVMSPTLLISDIVAVTDAGPYSDCPYAVDSLSKLIGTRIGSGWTKRVKELLGSESCTHLVEMLIPLATAAYQTSIDERNSAPDVLDPKGRSVRVDSCYAFADHRNLVKVRWPAFYVGKDSS